MCLGAQSYGVYKVCKVLLVNATQNERASERSRERERQTRTNIYTIHDANTRALRFHFGRLGIRKKATLEWAPNSHFSFFAFLSRLDYTIPFVYSLIYSQPLLPTRISNQTINKKNKKNKSEKSKIFKFPFNAQKCIVLTQPKFTEKKK